MKNCHNGLACTPSAGHHWRASITAMINRINNAICCLIVAAVFAMIGLDAGNQPGMTHSGSQEYVRHD